MVLRFEPMTFRSWVSTMPTQTKIFYGISIAGLEWYHWSMYFKTYATSVTRLGYFKKSWQQKFPSNVTIIFSDFLGYFENFIFQ